MLAALTAFAITSAARLLTGARALWLGSTAQATQRLYYANHSSHGDFVLLWASLPPGCASAPGRWPAPTTGRNRACAAS